jgi:hypothetical protein
MLNLVARKETARLYKVKIPSLFTDNLFILCNLNDIAVKAYFGMFVIFGSLLCLRG